MKHKNRKLEGNSISAVEVGCGLVGAGIALEVGNEIGVEVCDMAKKGYKKVKKAITTDKD